MTLEEVFAALEAQEGGADKIAAIKMELSKRNNEAANHRKLKTDAEKKAEALKTKVDAIYSQLGLDEDADAVAAVEALLKPVKGKGDGGDSAELAALKQSLQKQIDGLKKGIADKDNAIQAERQKRHGLLINGALQSELSKNKAVRPELLTGLLAGKVRVDGDDERLIFTLDDGTETEVGAGVAAFLKGVPEFVGNPGTPGAGGGGGIGGAGKRVFKASEVNPKFYEDNRDKFHSGEYQFSEDVTM